MHAGAGLLRGEDLLLQRVEHYDRLWVAVERLREGGAHRRPHCGAGVAGAGFRGGPATIHSVPSLLLYGGIVEKAMPIHQSNVAIFNAATGKADRVGIKLLADGKRVRVYKSSGEEIKVA